MLEIIAPAMAVMLLAFMLRRKLCSLFFGLVLYFGARNQLSPLFLRTGRS